MGKKGVYPKHLREANERKKIRYTVIDGIEGKPCATCKEWMPLEEFYSGEHRCKRCCQKRALAYHHAHSGEIAKRRSTPEHRARFNAYCRGWAKKKRQSDPNYRLRRNLRTSLLSAIKRNTKTGHTLDLLGCTIDELRMHLQFQFLPGMTWGNWSQDGWEIDHIIPISAFDLSKPAHQERCFHYSNLQPLWHDDNMRKGDYVPEGIVI